MPLGGPSLRVPSPPDQELRPPNPKGPLQAGSEPLLLTGPRGCVPVSSQTAPHP